MDCQSAFIVVISKTDIGFDGHVRLALHVEAIFHHIIRSFHDRFGIWTFGDVLFVIDIRCSRVDFDCVFSHSGRSIQVGGQNFQLYFDFLCCSFGLLDGIGAYNGDGIPILEDFCIA